jgi:DNA repair exonuclease SbcCD ATPase subunit
MAIYGQSSPLRVDRPDNTIQKGKNINFNQLDDSNLKAETPLTVESQKSVEKPAPKDFGDLVSRFEAAERESLQKNCPIVPLEVITGLKRELKQKDELIRQLREELNQANSISKSELESEKLIQELKRSESVLRALLVQAEQDKEKLREELAEKDETIRKYQEELNKPPSIQITLASLLPMKVSATF